MSRIVEGMSRYSNVGSTNSGTSKFSPWSRIPVKDSSVSSFIHCQLLTTNFLCSMYENGKQFYNDWLNLKYIVQFTFLSVLCKILKPYFYNPPLPYESFDIVK